MEKRRPAALRRFAVCTVTAASLAMAGCDAGKAPYQEGIALEEKGQLEEAAQKFDSVCRRAPRSKLCVESLDAAERVRLELDDLRLSTAKAELGVLKFADAEGLLRAVVDSKTTDAAHRALATALLGSPAMVAGLAWDKASAREDKRAAREDIEDIARTDTPVAEKAREWLQKERPALLLDDARRACTPASPVACPVACQQLIALHDGTPEAAEGRTMLAAWEAIDEPRVYPLLVDAEKLMAECTDIWKRQKTHADCAAKHGASTLSVFVACGDAQPITQRADRLNERWHALAASVGAGSPHAKELKERWEAACGKGEYATRVPKKP